MKKSCLKRGFTLIELLVVVLIIGVLAAIALPQYQKAVLRARAQEGLLYGREVVRELELYYLEHGQWLSREDLDKLPFSPKMPKDWSIFEWLPGSRVTLRFNSIRVNAGVWLYFFYSENPMRIDCWASKTSASAIATCMALSNGNEKDPYSSWRRFSIQ